MIVKKEGRGGRGSSALICPKEKHVVNQDMLSPSSLSNTLPSGAISGL